MSARPFPSILLTKSADMSPMFGREPGRDGLTLRSGGNDRPSALRRDIADSG
jgi:hypothetical protein